MRHLWVIAATVAMSSYAVADSAETKAQLECESAAYAQYKKDIDALYTGILTRPITIQEVMADRRLTEAYCLKQAACIVEGGDKPESLGQHFQSCLEGDAYEREKEQEELLRDTQ